MNQMRSINLVTADLVEAIERLADHVNYKGLLFTQTLKVTVTKEGNLYLDQLDGLPDRRPIISGTTIIGRAQELDIDLEEDEQRYKLAYTLLLEGWCSNTVFFLEADGSMQEYRITRTD